MEFEWDEAKNRINREKQGFDFAYLRWVDPSVR
jgi:uncharacterized DUF497 family protein